MTEPRSSHTATLLPDGRSFLVGGALGLATGEILMPAILGIDVRPGETDNVVNLRSNGNVPVAVLSRPGFDATAALVQSTIRFGPTGTEAPVLQCHAEDVNADGLRDLVCSFDIPAAGFYPGATEGVLRGITVARDPVVGRDAVRTIP